MIDPTEFAQLNSNAHQYYAKNSPAKSKAKGGRGGTLSSLISELGGAGGAFGGAAIGSAIMPGIGTLLGAGIGGFLGGTGGRIAENEVRDGRVGLGDALKEGAVSGVMGAGPIRSVKALGAGSKALVSGGAKVAAGKATGTTLEDALTAANGAYGAPGLISKTAGMVGNGSDKLAVKSFRFTPTQINDYKATHGEDVLDTIKNWHISKPEDIRTKAIEPLNEEFNNAVQAIGDVPKRDVLTELKNRYTELLNSTSLENKARGRLMKQQANVINKKYGNTIRATDLNGDRQEFDGLVNYTNKAADPAKADVNKRVADSLRTSLQDAADAKNIEHPEFGTLKNIGAELSKAIDLSRYATKQQGLGRGAGTVGMRDLLGASAGAVAGGPAVAIAATAGTHILNSPTGTRTLAKGTGMLANGLASAGHGLDTIGAAPLGAGLRAGLVGGAIPTSPSQPAQDPYGLMSPETAGQQPQDLASAMVSAQGAPQAGAAPAGTDPTAGAQTSPSPYSKENLIADIQRDPKHAADYINTYKSLDLIYNPPAPKTKSIGSTASGVIADTQTGLKALSDLSGSIQSSGANNPLIGYLRGHNPLDTGAQSLQAQIATAKQIVGKALEGGVLRKEDESKYAKILPTMTDTDATAQFKLQYLQQIITQRLNEYMANLGAGNGTLEDALLAAQQDQTQSASAF